MERPLCWEERGESPRDASTAASIHRAPKTLPRKSLLHPLPPLCGVASRGQEWDHTPVCHLQRPCNSLFGETHWCGETPVQRRETAPAPSSGLGRAQSESVMGRAGAVGLGHGLELPLLLGHTRGTKISCPSSPPQWETPSLLAAVPRHKRQGFGAQLLGALFLLGSSHGGVNTGPAAHQHCGGRA